MIPVIHPAKPPQSLPLSINYGARERCSGISLGAINNRHQHGRFTGNQLFETRNSNKIAVTEMER